MNETTTQQETQWVLRRLIEPMGTPALFWPLIFGFAVVMFIAAIKTKQLILFTIGFGTLLVTGAVSLIAMGLPWYYVAPLPALIVLLLLAVSVYQMFPLQFTLAQVVTVATMVLFVTVAGFVYAGVGYMFREAFTWWLVLVPTMVLAFVFVVAMYWQDSQSVNVGWAGFLGLLRLLVYAILGLCFMLPALQQYDTTTTESSVLVLFDVSDSMWTSDGEDPAKRNDKVIKFLTTPYPQGSHTKTFMEHLTDSSPVICYRFGGVPDDESVIFKAGKKSWTADEWRVWLSPNKKDLKDPKDVTDAEEKKRLFKKLELIDNLRNSTDIGGSALKVLSWQTGRRIQAVFVVSDGHSNKLDDKAIDTLRKDVAKNKPPIHILTVGVGQEVLPGAKVTLAKLEIDQPGSPGPVRFDEKFNLSVRVFGDGLVGEEIDVTLELQRLKNDKKEAVAISELKESEKNSLKEKHKVLLKELREEFPDFASIDVKNNSIKLVRKPAFPNDDKYIDVAFPIDLPALTGLNPEIDADKARLTGEWTFKVSIPRHAQEKPDTKTHETKPVEFPVTDNPIRILLFSSGPSRDYQFVRRLMSAEVDLKKAHLSIYLQSAKGLDDVSQDVDGNRLLPDFPTKLTKIVKGAKGSKDGQDDPMNLMAYDVVIAFDPDWTALSKKQKEQLKDWVEGEHRGGLIFVAGPQHMQRFIPPPDPDIFAKWDMKPIFDVFPVILRRPPAKLQGEYLHDSTIPYTLNFTGLAKGMSFLRLDASGKSTPLEGWEKYFGKYVKSDFGGLTKVHPERGFFSYYRVEEVKENAQVIATFGDPKAPKTKDNKDQPFFVSMSVAGNGKTFYIGSGEIWRLRTFDEEYFKEFWNKLCRHVSSGTGGKLGGRIEMPPTKIKAGDEWVLKARILDVGGGPVAKDAQLKAIFDLSGAGAEGDAAKTYDLAGKQATKKWRGDFEAKIKLDAPGYYTVRIQVPGRTDAITKSFEVEPPNDELTKTQPKFIHLYNMSTDLTPEMEAKLDEVARDRLGKNRPAAGEKDKVASGSRNRLYLPLSWADSFSQCVVKVPAEKESVKGQMHDLWTKGSLVYDKQYWVVPTEKTAKGGFILPRQTLGQRFAALFAKAETEKVVELSPAEIEEARTKTVVPAFYYALFAVPAVVLLISTIFMLIGARWFAALGMLAVLVAVEVGLDCLMIFLTPEDVFYPSAYHVILVVPMLIVLIATSILLVAQRWIWVAVCLVGMLAYCLGFLLLDLVVEPAWVRVPIDFTWLMLTAGLLLSLEWFTRKMLRLA